MLVLGIAKLRHFRQIYLSKAVNAHDGFRGLYLLGRLGSRRPRIPNKKKVPRFFMPLSQRKKLANRHWGLWQSKEISFKSNLKKMKKVKVEKKKIVEKGTKTICN